MKYFEFKNWIYISLENPYKTMKKLKGVFKPLKCYFKCTFDEWNYSPVLWCSRPSIVQIITRDVMWKDKQDTPRYEVPPYIWIHVYKLNLVWYWDLSLGFKFANPRNDMVDDYWEQALWYLYYYHDNYGNTMFDKHLDKPNINIARDMWPGMWYNTQESTWSDKYLEK